MIKEVLKRLMNKKKIGVLDIYFTFFFIFMYYKVLLYYYTISIVNDIFMTSHISFQVLFIYCLYFLIYSIILEKDENLELSNEQKRPVKWRQFILLFILLYYIYDIIITKNSYSLLCVFELGVTINSCILLLKNLYSKHIDINIMKNLLSILIILTLTQQIKTYDTTSWIANSICLEEHYNFIFSLKFLFIVLIILMCVVLIALFEISIEDAINNVKSIKVVTSFCITLLCALFLSLYQLDATKEVCQGITIMVMSREYLQIDVLNLTIIIVRLLMILCVVGLILGQNVIVIKDSIIGLLKVLLVCSIVMYYITIVLFKNGYIDKAIVIQDYIEVLYNYNINLKIRYYNNIMYEFVTSDLFRNYTGHPALVDTINIRGEQKTYILSKLSLEEIQQEAARDGRKILDEHTKLKNILPTVLLIITIIYKFCITN